MTFASPWNASLDRLRHCLAAVLADEAPMHLPEHVARALRLPTHVRRGTSYAAVIAWFERRGECPRERDVQRWIVYQAYLEPFLGVDGERGTILSFLLHIPSLIEHLGANTVILLPVLRRGAARLKGTTASPFAVAEHLEIEPSLAGSGLTVTPNEWWRVIVDVCHHVGLNVGMILPLATLSIDSPRIASRPGLVHWWRASVDEVLCGSPLSDVARPWRKGAVPAASAEGRFVEPPLPGTVLRERAADGSWLLGARTAAGERITVANAYPDPVVGPEATDSWQDVAAVRFTSSIAPVAYGTKVEKINQDAVEFVNEVLQSPLFKDVALLCDVSSQLPPSLLASIPGTENSTLIAEELWSFTAPAQYSAVLGPLIPCVAAHWRDPNLLLDSLVYHLQLLGETSDPRPFFAGVANHDSAPVPASWAMPMLLIFCLLPGSIPFLYSGTEFGNTIPTNLEFGVLERLGGNSSLLLFNQRSVSDEPRSRAGFVRFWRDVLRLRATLRVGRHTTESPQSVERDGHCVRVRRPGYTIHANFGDGTRVIETEPARTTIHLRSRVELRSDRIRMPPCSVFVALDDNRADADELEFLQLHVHVPDRARRQEDSSLREAVARARRVLTTTE